MRQTLTGIFIVCILIAGGCAERSPQAVLTPIEDRVSVTGGIVKGITIDGDLRKYQAIPYAAAPVGKLRWAPPAPPEPWVGVLAADRAGPACMQPEGLGGEFYGESDVEMDEDCLLLNVWTRAEHQEDSLPVMVWVHGGGLLTGQGAAYPGDLLTSKGVVLVPLTIVWGVLVFLRIRS